MRKTREDVKTKVQNALCAQFESYSWEQLIGDALDGYPKAAIAWAKTHLDYQLVEVK